MISKSVIGNTQQVIHTKYYVVDKICVFLLSVYFLYSLVSFMDKSVPYIPVRVRNCECHGSEHIPLLNPRHANVYGAYVCRRGTRLSYPVWYHDKCVRVFHIHKPISNAPMHYVQKRKESIIAHSHDLPLLLQLFSFQCVC